MRDLIVVRWLVDVLSNMIYTPVKGHCTLHRGCGPVTNPILPSHSPPTPTMLLPLILSFQSAVVKQLMDRMNKLEAQVFGAAASDPPPQPPQPQDSGDEDDFDLFGSDSEVMNE